MLEAQGGVCAICKAAPAVHVDHETGAVRALLCFSCNGGLGRFKDDPPALHAAAYYVRFHTLRQAAMAELPAGSDAPSRPPARASRR
jgi:hypothetical protein